MMRRPPLEKKGWDHRVDCFSAGILVGLLSTSALINSGLDDGGLYAAVVATLTLPPLGLQMRTPDDRSRCATMLTVTWQCVLGVLAVTAGLSVGITLAP